jgi:conjugal transfer pilin signal peptidase TrbI
MLRRLLKAAERLAAHLLRLPGEAAIALGGDGAKERPCPKRLASAMAIVLPIAAAAAWFLPKLTLVMTPSIEAWLLHAAPGPIRRGDLVSFMLVHPLAGPAPVRVTKHALCLPGERIDWVEKPIHSAGRAWEAWYFCEGRLLGVSKPSGHGGRPLPFWRPGYRVIPPGFVYVGSAHASGFDSRYYGPVAISRLTRMEKLL